MKYRTIGGDPARRREVSVLSLGAMLFGTVTDEKTSFAILDRYVEAGGTFIDTSDNYAFWVDGTVGGESETLLGNWRRSRGIGDEIFIATKLGAAPLAPGTGYLDNPEGLSAKAIRSAVEGSKARLGVERLDLLYAHIPDRKVELVETVREFGALVQEGAVGLLGVSNHWAWQVERARAIARAEGLAGYEVLQYQHSYLRHRTDLSSELSPDGVCATADGNLLSMVRAERDLALVAYSPLLTGAYVREDKPLGAGHDHGSREARLTALREVATSSGATVNQVVLAWMLGADVPAIPLVGASSVAQLEESLSAVDLELTEEERARLNAA
ncbi:MULTISPECIES: aldo/keto reductase [unclassified Streptomyces]|uniref:aldo/keto reductase n=1 Tax=unclassified Streptomyces TaxID=2593676 RepID=UPI000DB90C9E|nr:MULTISPECIES: aldo/keto reductase [unclassified Streptomyces]MYT74341.1 aldo/keto reductase [Streptomyces sp. SID8367]RAJ91317.1 aryl-alcohol dehydrogenase-like predicted oxidoreductase [Streptomyces sp. PsTaAH-137]